jgi:carbon storage regulator
MLVISRRKGQRIAIGDDIEIVITEVHRSSVKLGILAPRGYTVLRGEVSDAISAANREAASISLERAGELAGTAPRDGISVSDATAKLGLRRHPSDASSSQSRDAARPPAAVTGEPKSEPPSSEAVGARPSAAPSTHSKPGTP